MNKENKQRIETSYKKFYKEKYPSLPEIAIPKRVFSDSNTKSLTHSVVDFLNFNGHHASEQRTTGTRVDKTKIVEDCLGRRRMIGNVQWGASQDELGRADIIAKIMIPYKDRFIPVAVEIEIKFGRDFQSEKQKEFQQKLENLGGIYIIVKNFDQFILWYDDFIKKY